MSERGRNAGSNGEPRLELDTEAQALVEGMQELGPPTANQVGDVAVRATGVGMHLIDMTKIQSLRDSPETPPSSMDSESQPPKILGKPRQRKSRPPRRLLRDAIGEENLKALIERRKADRQLAIARRIESGRIR